MCLSTLPPPHINWSSSNLKIVVFPPIDFISVNKIMIMHMILGYRGKYIYMKNFKIFKMFTFYIYPFNGGGIFFLPLTVFFELKQYFCRIEFAGMPGKSNCNCFFLLYYKWLYFFSFQVCNLHMLLFLQRT